MNPPRGVFEELIHKNKNYPDNQHIRVIPTTVMRDFSHTIQQYIEQGQYGKILGFVQQLNKITQTEHQEYQLPIKAIHYRHDDGLLPRNSKLCLSQLNLLINTDAEQWNLFKALKYEFQTADQADFMVSFVRWSGLQLLIREIDEFRKADDGRMLRILTSI